MTQKTPPPRTPDKHPGMMGDGTEEQNLNQKGDPGARFTEAEVKEAFGEDHARGPKRPG